MMYFFVVACMVDDEMGDWFLKVGNITCMALDNNGKVYAKDEKEKGKGGGFLMCHHFLLFLNPFCHHFNY